jgi:hypothetical protein
VAVSVMPQPIVVFFPAHWAFSIFELNIYKLIITPNLYKRLEFGLVGVGIKKKKGKFLVVLKKIVLLVIPMP